MLFRVFTEVSALHQNQFASTRGSDLTCDKLLEYLRETSLITRLLPFVQEVY